MDRPSTPVGESNMDLFPRAAIIYHSAQRRILFRYPRSALYPVARGQH
jgi:hypothetical protein